MEALQEMGFLEETPIVAGPFFFLTRNNYFGSYPQLLVLLHRHELSQHSYSALRSAIACPNSPAEKAHVEDICWFSALIFPVMKW